MTGGKQVVVLVRKMEDFLKNKDTVTFQVNIFRSTFKSLSNVTLTLSHYTIHLCMAQASKNEGYASTRLKCLYGRLETPFTMSRISATQAYEATQTSE